MDEMLEKSYRQEMDLLYANEITELKNRLSGLESIRESLNEAVNKNYHKEAELKTYLVDECEDMGEHAINIAKIFDIELTKEVTYDVTIVTNITVQVPVDEVDNIDDFISSNLSVSSYTNDIDVNDFSVESCEESY